MDKHFVGLGLGGFHGDVLLYLVAFIIMVLVPFLILVFLFISNSCRTAVEYFSGELIEGRFCEDGQL